MSYPGTIDSFTPKVDDSDDVLAAHVNKLQVATAAIETELGTDPAGSQTNVKTRLAHLMSAAGYLEFDQETLLTISSGAITVAQNLHRIETEAGAASDYLDTINGHSNGLFLIVRASNDAHTVVIRHDEGNILCTGGANISLDSTDELAWGYYDGTLSKWILMRGLSGEALTGAGADNQVAVFTGASTQDSSDKLTFDGTTLEVTGEIAAISDADWIGIKAGESASKYVALSWRNVLERAEFYTKSYDYPILINNSLWIETDGNNGNVGIGEFVPLARCHIKGSADDQVLIVQAYSTQTTNIIEVQDSAGNADVFVISRYERVGIGESNPGAMIHAWQRASDGNCPVLILMQSDLDKEIIYYVGTAASANLTRSLVDEGDQSTTTLAGWVKVYIQDDGNQITDGTYFMPFYTLA